MDPMGLVTPISKFLLVLPPGTHPLETQDAGSSPPEVWSIFGIGNPNLNGMLDEGVRPKWWSKSSLGKWQRFVGERNISLPGTWWPSIHTCVVSIGWWFPNHCEKVVGVITISISIHWKNWFSLLEFLFRYSMLQLSSMQGSRYHRGSLLSQCQVPRPCMAWTWHPSTWSPRNADPIPQEMGDAPKNDHMKTLKDRFPFCRRATKPFTDARGDRLTSWAIAQSWLRRSPSWN